MFLSNCTCGLVPFLPARPPSLPFPDGNGGGSDCDDNNGHGDDDHGEGMMPIWGW